MIYKVLANTSPLSPQLHSNHLRGFSRLFSLRLWTTSSWQQSDKPLDAMVKLVFALRLLWPYRLLVQLLSMELQFRSSFSTVPGSMVCDIRENSLSCILADNTLATTLSLSGFRLNRTVLRP